jgi:hypothetical protein
MLKNKSLFLFYVIEYFPLQWFRYLDTRYLGWKTILMSLYDGASVWKGLINHYK